MLAGMRPATPLPKQLNDRPVTAALLDIWGISRQRLLRRDMVSLGSGVYVPRHVAELADDDARYGLRAAGVAGDFPEGWLCHVTAARLIGCALPARLSTSPVIHVAHARESDFRVRREGVRGHRLSVGEREVIECSRIRMTSPARTWRDLARYCDVEELVVAGDHLVRRPNPHFEGRSQPHCTVTELYEAVESSPRYVGRPKSVAALGLIRVGADSAPETLLRLRLMKAGLPEPQLQVPPVQGALFGYRADMGYPQWKIAIQYDGAKHFNPERARTDQRRDNAFISDGWMLLRFNREDLREGFRSAVHQVAAAVDLRCGSIEL